MFKCLGVTPYDGYVLVDTVSNEIELTGAVEHGVRLGLVDLLDCAEFDDKNILSGDGFVPFSVENVKLLNVVRKYVHLWKEKVVRLKLIGERDFFTGFKNFPVEEGYQFFDCEEWEKVGFRGNDASICCYIMCSKNGFEVFVDYKTLETWEMIEIINKYGNSAINERGCKVDLSEIFEMSGIGWSINILMDNVSIFHKNGGHTIGFLKDYTKFYRKNGSTEEFNFRYVVIKVNTETDKLWVLEIENEDAVEIEFAGCCNPENIVWLSQDITEERIAWDKRSEAQFAKEQAEKENC